MDACRFDLALKQHPEYFKKKGRNEAEKVRVECTRIVLKKGLQDSEDTRNTIDADVLEDSIMFSLEQ